MIWVCLYKWGFGPLTVTEGTVNQEEYINILAGELHGWFKEMPDKENKDFILQEDGASCHTGAYARWWKETYQI